MQTISRPCKVLSTGDWMILLSDLMLWLVYIDLKQNQLGQWYTLETLLCWFLLILYWCSWIFYVLAAFLQMCHKFINGHRLNIAFIWLDGIDFDWFSWNFIDFHMFLLYFGECVITLITLIMAKLIINLCFLLVPPSINLDNPNQSCSLTNKWNLSQVITFVSCIWNVYDLWNNTNRYPLKYSILNEREPCEA